MSRHGGNAGRRLPFFQLEIADYSKRRNGRYTTSWLNFSKGQKGKIDRLPLVPCRTLLKRFKDGESAKRWGARFGTVISCRKVDTAPYFKNIEYLNLTGKPISIEFDKEEYMVNKALELSRPRIDFEDKKIDVQIVDNDKGV